MGGSASSDKFGKIFVKTEKNVYFPGETVSGWIFLNIVQVYPGSTLEIKIKGKEVLEIFKKAEEQTQGGVVSSKTKKNLVVETEKHENIFYHHKMPIYAFDTKKKGIQPGQYMFPFSFLLQSYLPGSFEYKDEDVRARIYYKIKAHIIPDLKPKEPHMKFTQKVMLREKHKSNITKTVFTGIYKTLWCLSSGRTNVSFEFDKDHYTPNDRFTMNIEVDNSTSSIPIQQFLLFIIAKFTFTTKDGRSMTKERNMAKRVFPGVPAGGRLMDDKKIFVELLMKDEKDVYFPASVHANLIQCDYFVELSYIYPQSKTVCFSGYNGERLPFTMITGENLANSSVATPNNWNPTVFPATNLLLTDAYLYKINQEQLTMGAPKQSESTVADDDEKAKLNTEN